MGVRGRVTGAVAVVVVAGAAVAADRWALGVAEDRVAQGVQAGIEGTSARPDVRIAGFPFLTQLASGSIDDLAVALPVAVLGGVEVHDVDVTAHGVSTGEPYVATSAELTGTVTTQVLERLLTAATELGDVQVTTGDGLVTAAARVVGRDITADLAPRPQGRAIAVDVVRATVDGVTVDVADLPARVEQRVTGLTIPVEGLPQGTELTGVAVQADGVRLTAAGSDVTLAQTS